MFVANPKIKISHLYKPLSSTRELDVLYLKKKRVLKHSAFQVVIALELRIKIIYNSTRAAK